MKTQHDMYEYKTAEEAFLDSDRFIICFEQLPNKTERKRFMQMIEAHRLPRGGN